MDYYLWFIKNEQSPVQKLVGDCRLQLPSACAVNVFDVPGAGGFGEEGSLKSGGFDFQFSDSFCTFL